MAIEALSEIRCTKCRSVAKHCASCGGALKSPAQPAQVIVHKPQPGTLETHRIAITLLDECARALDPDEPVVDVDALLVRVERFLTRRVSKNQLPQIQDKRHVLLTWELIASAFDGTEEQLVSYIVEDDGLSARCLVRKDETYTRNVLVVLGPERR